MRKCNTHLKSLSPNAACQNRDLCDSEGELKWTDHLELSNIKRGRKKHVQGMTQVIEKQPSQLGHRFFFPLKIFSSFLHSEPDVIKTSRETNSKCLWGSLRVKTLSASWGSSRILESGGLISVHHQKVNFDRGWSGLSKHQQQHLPVLGTFAAKYLPHILFKQHIVSD